jgi:FkbM family methyltransferase
MGRVARNLRRLAPAAVRRRLRRAMFVWLELTWTTASGIGLRVANYNEWIIYNEIFVDAEYDAAIAAAISNRDTGDLLRVVDLGANVGFFTLRLFDRLRVAGSTDASCAVTAIDAHPEVVQVLRSRVHDDNPLAERVQIVSGLVGQSTGERRFYRAADSPGESSVARHTGDSGVTIGFVDLTRLFQDVPVIDLLKCDVEGAELSVIEHHPAVLAKTRVAVFEIHHDLCPIDRCRDLLRAAGLTTETVLRDRGGHSLRLYARTRR